MYTKEWRQHLTAGPSLPCSLQHYWSRQGLGTTRVYQMNSEGWILYASNGQFSCLYKEGNSTTYGTLNGKCEWLPKVFTNYQTCSWFLPISSATGTTSTTATAASSPPPPPPLLQWFRPKHRNEQTWPLPPWLPHSRKLVEAENRIVTDGRKWRDIDQLV